MNLTSNLPSKSMHAGSSHLVAKHQMVREALVESIRLGEFSPGERLPSERELAVKYKVSYMTARRAVTEMVEADLLERRASEGTYVRAHSQKHVGTVTVNLIYPPHYGTTLEQFLHLGISGIEQRGWQYHVIHLQTERERPALRVLANGEFAIILTPEIALDGVLRRAMEESAGRAILVGNHLDSQKVPSIMADDAQAIRLLVGHLQGAGHRAIGIVTNDPEHNVDRVQLATWRACCSSDASPQQLKNRTIVVNAPNTTVQAKMAYDAVRNALKSPDRDLTALICLNDELTVATMAACRSIGLTVPQDISIVTSGNGPLLEYFNPPVTCVDLHLDLHINYALEMLESTLKGCPWPALTRLVPPSLIIRESVAQVR